MNDYTPTLDEVREEWCLSVQDVDMDGSIVVSYDEVAARFDRWLAEHDRQVVAKALEDAAAVWTQGAAPQLIGRLDLARHYWRSQGYDYDLHGLDGNNDYEMGMAVADAALAALAAAQGAAPRAESATQVACAMNHAGGVCPRYPHVAPVLPSSGVDEDKLAEVIRQQFEVGNIYLDSFECKIAARAVAEWLKGQGR